jgi:hypothetical protein
MKNKLFYLFLVVLISIGNGWAACDYKNVLNSLQTEDSTEARSHNVINLIRLIGHLPYLSSEERKPILRLLVTNVLFNDEILPELRTRVAWELAKFAIIHRVEEGFVVTQILKYYKRLNDTNNLAADSLNRTKERQVLDAYFILSVLRYCEVKISLFETTDVQTDFYSYNPRNGTPPRTWINEIPYDIYAPFGKKWSTYDKKVRRTSF